MWQICQRGVFDVGLRRHPHLREKNAPPNKQTTKISGSKSAFGMALWHHLWWISSATPDSRQLFKQFLPLTSSAKLLLNLAYFGLASWFLGNKKAGGVVIKKQDLPTGETQTWIMFWSLQAWGKDLLYTNKTKNDLNISQLLRIHLDVRCHKTKITFIYLNCTTITCPHLWTTPISDVYISEIQKFCIHTHINKYAKININIYTYIPRVCLCVIKLPLHKWNWTEIMPMTHVQPVDASGPCIIPCNFCREMGSHDGRPSTNAQRCGNLGAFV